MDTPLTVEYGISSAGDDAEQHISGGLSENVSDLDFGSKIVGLRFTGIDIPPEAIITGAYIQFVAEDAGTDTASLTVRGEDSDDAAAFLDVEGVLSSRPTTEAVVAWTPPAWQTAGEAGLDQRTPDIAAIVQEIVSRDGWARLSDMVFLIEGSGTRSAMSYEGDPAAAPRLNISWVMPTTTPEPDDGSPDDGSEVPIVTPEVFETRIASAEDDVEEQPNGRVNFHSSDIEMGQDGSRQQTIGLRFIDVEIPENATITSAYIQFQADEVSRGPAVLTIRGFDTDDLGPFTTVRSDLSSRPTTDAVVEWTPVDWETVGEAGADQQSPDLSAILQEIVNRDGWAALNDLGFAIEGTGDRTAEAYDGNPDAAPLLHVEYVLPAADTTAPTVAITGPEDNSTVTGVITVTVDAQDDTGIRDVQLRIDSEVFGQPDSDSPYTFTIDTALLTDTNITLSVLATDLAGNETISEPVALQIDNALPPPPPPPPPSGVIRVPEDFSSIQDAIDAAGNGDTVLVGPGSYEGGFTITGKSITLASLYHTTGDPSYIGSTIIQGGSPAVHVTNSAPNTTIEGFHIIGGEDAIVIAGEGGQALNNLIEDSRRDSISFENAGGVARGNHIIAPGDDGFDVDHAEGDLVIEDNLIEEPDDDGIEVRNGGYDGPLLTLVIRGNRISGAEQDGVQLIDYDPISNREFVLERNLILNSGHSGLGIMDNGETFEDFRAASMPERVYVLNNTFDGNSHGITGGDNLIALNNIVSNSSVLGIKNIDGDSIVAHTLFFNNNTDQTGSNIDEDTIPFADPHYTPTWGLEAGSPSIDAGVAQFVHGNETVLSIPESEYFGTAPDLGWIETA